MTSPRRPPAARRPEREAGAPTASPEAPIEFPPLVEGELDGTDVARLLGELAAAATGIEVLVRHPGRRDASAAPHAPGAPPTPLSEVEPLLASGAARGVQLRYVWSGAAWIDTILPSSAPGRYRLVRIRHGEERAAAPAARTA